VQPTVQPAAWSPDADGRRMTVIHGPISGPTADAGPVRKLVNGGSARPPLGGTLVPVARRRNGSANGFANGTARDGARRNAVGKSIRVAARTGGAGDGA